MSVSPQTGLENAAGGPTAAEGAFVTEPVRSKRERLGPILMVSKFQSPVVGRLYAAGIAVACGAILGVAARIHATGTGFGTHQQLGLPACAFLARTGYPCITCGMTTSFADFTKGRFLRSLLDQPMGFALALSVAVAGVVSLAAAATGRCVWINWYRVNPVSFVWGAVFLLMGGWAFKIMYGLATGVLPAH
jgi:hypothetical protein